MNTPTPSRVERRKPIADVAADYGQPRWGNSRNLQRVARVCNSPLILLYKRAAATKLNCVCCNTPVVRAWFVDAHNNKKLLLLL